jgi:pyruvate dehydrogenase E1 component alpha subunit/2-oxoisovalerate dehydrogenase E1 component alpha subunit
MVRIRRLDERMTALHRQGRVGFYGSALGQEAVPVALGLALRETDWVFPALRESSVMLVRGFALERYLAQVFGSDADVQRGRQMPSHMAARAVNVVSWSSCIGTQLPHAVGAAWAMKLRGTGDVAVACLGDGATSSGDFHAALNFAAVAQAPVVFVCQNNHYAISTPVARQTRVQSLFEKSAAYAIPGERVDGNDVLALIRALRERVRDAREGRGPAFLEALTYRRGPHSSSDDPSRYRDEAEARAWEPWDPLTRLERYLEEVHGFAATDRAAVERDVQQEITAAIHAAERVNPPALETLFEDVYASSPRGIPSQLAAREGPAKVC